MSNLPAAAEAALRARAGGGAASRSTGGAGPWEARATAGPWRTLLEVGGLWLLTRVLIAVTGGIGALVAPAHGLTARAACGGAKWCADPALPGAGLLGVPRAIYVLGTSWDASWYLQVLQAGYVRSGAGFWALGFYPGFSLLGAVIYWPLNLVHGGTGAVLGPAALLLTSNVCLVVALWALWRLYVPLLGRRATLVGSALVLAAPGSVFLSGAFSESPFVAATALAMLAAHRGRWVWAGVAAGAACLLRPHGALILLPLAVLWAQAPTRPRLRSIAGLAALAVGAAAFPAYTWIAFADPLLYSHVKAQGWGVRLENPAVVLASTGQWALTGAGWLVKQEADGLPRFAGAVNYGALAVTNAVAAFSAVAAAFLSWLRLPASHTLWAVLMVVVPLLSGIGNSPTRYELAAWPIYYFLGSLLRSPWLAVPAVALSCVGLAVISYDFQQGYFVA